MVPAAFVETPEGVRRLNHLVVVAHLEVTLQGGAGVRMMCQFLAVNWCVNGEPSITPMT